MHAGNAVLRWTIPKVKLVLEWVAIPFLVIALQLPQGAVWYWLTSSLTALAQVGLGFPHYLRHLMSPSARGIGLKTIGRLHKLYSLCSGIVVCHQLLYLLKTLCLHTLA